MESERNALAELAEDLEVLKVILEHECHPKGTQVADKAQRIVAELAKVSEGEWIGHLGGNFYLCRAESRVVETIVGKCREIAEEGNDDAQIA